ncbi:MAG TPA: RNA polymerase sigma factor [Candidatus Aquilonibacter sp.]|nr:RNA polymerase sigma factor [Candidatus Aquilonibacter sp.]
MLSKNYWNLSFPCREYRMTSREAIQEFCPTGMEENEARSDVELLQHALAGDEASFRLLYGRLKNGIFRYALYMTNSTTAAEEVTQEVFLTLLKRGRRYDASQGDLAAFTFGIARNIVHRVARRERPYLPLVDHDAAEKAGAGALAEGPANVMLREELIASIRSAIASLPEHYRQAVVLCDLCELSYAEAAARLDCAVGTVRSRLHRGHALLAQKLKLLRNPQTEFPDTGAEGCLI